MSKEDFLEVLQRQYAERVQEAYIECEHQDGQIDLQRLQDQIVRLQKNSRVEGLSAKQFTDILESTLPEEVKKLLQQNKKSAA
ncbi:MAG: hypothetical protein AB7F43_06050 [Bacteriovoracia bacterium]